MNVKSILVVSLFLLSSNVQAGFINDENNEVYYTNKDIGLDIMRLSYSDLIEADGTKSTDDNKTSAQADIERVNSFLNGVHNVADDFGNKWRWATFQELNDVYSVFDSHPNVKSWSDEQYDGSLLFFELNGTGTYQDIYLDNGGFHTSGDVRWYATTVIDPNEADEDISDLDTQSDMWHFLIRMYAENGQMYNGVNLSCDPDQPRCGQGYHTGDLAGKKKTNTTSDLSTFSDSAAVNFAPLLVRTHVPEPSAFVIMALALTGLLIRRRKSVLVKR